MQNAQDALVLASELRSKREFSRAEQLVESRLAENPHDADALHLLGLLARDTGRLNFSVEVLRQAIRLNDSVPVYHFDLALGLNRLGHVDAAMDHFRRACELKPDYQDAVVNVGTLLHRSDRLEEAGQWFQRAIKLNGNCPIARYNLANIQQALGKLDDAKRGYARAIELEPNFAKAHWNKALCHLLAGEFAEGWGEFAWRRAAGEVTIDNYPQPLWRGEPLGGKTILVHAEQGVGDEILFATCLPDLIAQAGRLILVCEPRLATLFARSFPQARIHAHARRKDRAPAEVGEAVDYQAPLGDLPRYFRRDLASFPDRMRHLVPDEARVTAWRDRFGKLGPGFKVGISWQAGGKPHERRNRSTALADWLPLFAIPNVHFVNIQYGECVAEIATAREQFSLQIHEFDQGDPLVDLDEFAAKIAALDLVISVGNTTVHLAGALGVRAWTLLPTVPGWRWLIAGERNPWYPSVRAIRQTRPGDWRPVFASVAARLKDAAQSMRRDEPPNTRTDVNDNTSPRDIESLNQTRCLTATQSPDTTATSFNSPIGFDVAKALDELLVRFRSGELQIAETICHSILAHAPRNVRALHCLGQIARQSGRLELAIRSLTRAAAADGNQPLIWLDLARTLLAAGNREQAIDAYQKVVAIDPRHAEGWFELATTLRAAGRHEESYRAYCAAAPTQFSNPKVFNYLGAACLELGKLEEGERAFRRAVDLAPTYHAAWNNLGCSLARQGKHAEAVSSFERALQIDPASADARKNLSSLQSSLVPSAAGTSNAAQPAASNARATRHPPLSPELAERLQTAGKLYNEERFDEADVLAREVLAVEPHHPVALRIAGVAARRAGRVEEAIELLSKASQLDPAAHALQFELGVTYLERYRHKEAFESFLRCYQLRPEFQPACINLAGILEQQERYEEAIPWALKAVELNGDCYMAHYNLANNYREMGRLREAIVHYERAIALNPQYVRADWNLGICHLHLGNYEQGWPRYEQRVSAEEVKIDTFTEPRWNGEPLAGKTIVVHAEQGIGDEIVFCSCLPELISKAGRVIVVCEPRLEKLFRRSFPQCKVYGYARRKNWAPCPLEEHVDYQIPMGSLPLYLRPTRASFPRRDRFLVPSPALVDEWRKRFTALGRGLKIGVSWRAGGKPLERRKRSVPLELWAPVFQVPAAQFINLQYGDAIEDAAEVRDLFNVELHDWDLGDPLVDVDNFAAKVAALDLVISVGNATVHIAGAVGTPAWTLLPMVPSWRWMVEGDTSPWYTSVRLFRQPRRNDWRPVFVQIGGMLREVAATAAGDYRRRAMDVRAPVVTDDPSQPPPRASNEEWLDASQICVKATLDSIPELMKTAEEHFVRGELDAAEEIYRRVLLLSPRFPSALQGLSRVARRLGKTELAIRSIKRALATAENVPERRCDLAAALADAGRHDEAAESYLRAIELNPQYVRAHLDFGLMLQALGRHDEAQGRLRQALLIEPDRAEAAVALARSLVVLCRPDEAAAGLQQFVEKHPGCTLALLALAEIYRDDQLYPEAEACLRRALAIDPGLIAAHLRLAELLARNDRNDEAVSAYQAALQIDPNHYDSLVELGTFEDRLGRAVEAEQCFRRAKAVSARPPRELVNSLGIALADQGRLTEALECFDEALQISGERPYANAHANRAFALVQLGCFAEGWREYEWRWHCPDAGRPPDQLRVPVWDGTSDLNGRTLLVQGEQGLGDEIMFASCYADVIQRAKKTIILCEPRLERLFRRSFPRARVIPLVRGLEHQWQIPPELSVDFQLAAGSLPMHFRKSESDFPRRPFLNPDPALVAVWKERFDALGSGPKIGISWRAGDKPKERRLRTTRLEQWQPILKIPNAHFVNLQHGDCAADIESVRRTTGVTVHHWRDSDNRNDIEGLAARMAALDLIVSVGNAGVHLAGALGLTAWALLPVRGGWRWLSGRNDSPWYRNVRLFRQAAPNDWDELFLRVRQELLQHLGKTADPRTMRPVPVPHWTGFAAMPNAEARMTYE